MSQGREGSRSGETGIRRTKRRRLQSRGREDRGGILGDKELVAGGRRSQRLRLDAEGSGDSSYMTEGAGTTRGRSGGRSHAGRPVTPCPGLPQPSCPFL